MEDGQAMPIAIVGMGCRFPGDATQPEKLWDLIMRKKSARTEMPSDRFNIDGFYHPEAGRYGSVSIAG
jgi:acyl transferase domain-containing protein